MDHSDWRWVIGTLLTMVVTCVSTYIALVIRIVRLEARSETMEQKVDNNSHRLETLIEGLGRRAARGLHSPDDHHNLDAQIDSYLKGTATLGREFWQSVRAKCDKIVDKPGTTTETGLAALLSAVCEVKIKELEQENEKTN